MWRRLRKFGIWAHTGAFQHHQGGGVKGFALDDMPGVRDAVGPISSDRGTRFVNGALGHVKREGKSVSLAMSVSFWWLSETQNHGAVDINWTSYNLRRLCSSCWEREREREFMSIGKQKSGNRKHQNDVFNFAFGLELHFQKLLFCFYCDLWIHQPNMSFTIFQNKTTSWSLVYAS